MQLLQLYVCDHFSTTPQQKFSCTLCISVRSRSLSERGLNLDWGRRRLCRDNRTDLWAVTFGPGQWDESEVWCQVKWMISTFFTVWTSENTAWWCWRWKFTSGELKRCGLFFLFLAVPIKSAWFEVSSSWNREPSSSREQLNFCNLPPVC